MSDAQQEIYINLNDSEKLTSKEHVSVYGGLVFFSKKEKDKFITQYRSIVKDIRCGYCNGVCDNNCPEIKNTSIKPSDKRRLMNHIKRYFIVGLIIKNDDVYEHIIESKAARGRFVDYSIRRLIKEIVLFLISNEKIDPNKPIKLIINIDQQSTKSNGYYNLHDGLIEELKYGIVNFNYSALIKPIVYSDLNISISYQDSGKSYAVQAADLLAGTIRKKAIEELDGMNSLADLFIILP